MKKKLIKSRKINSIIIASIMIGSIFITSTLTEISVRAAEPLGMKLIQGTTEKCNGEIPNIGENVNITITSNEGTRYGIYDPNSGVWQVDIGSGPGGSDWPDGISFTGTIIYNDEDGYFSGSFSGNVNEEIPVTDVGLIVIDPSDLAIIGSADATEIDIGQCVSFTATTSGGCKPYSYLWEFISGNEAEDESTEKNPVYCFNIEGYYECKATVTDDCGNTDTDTIFITVGDPLKNPIADYSWEQIDCHMVFFTDLSSDSDGTITSYYWDFDDGTTTTEPSPTHEFSQTGRTYTVCLQVLDNDNLTGISCQSIYIPISPSAGFEWKRTADKTIELTDLTTDEDSVICSYSWEFGDGDTSSDADTSHMYDKYGIYNVTLTVSTEYGCTSTLTEIVNVERPILTITKPKIGYIYIGDREGTSLDLDLTIILAPSMKIRTKSSEYLDKVVFTINGIFGNQYIHSDTSYPFEWDFDDSLLLFCDELMVQGYIGNQQVITDTIDDLIIYGCVQI